MNISTDNVLFAFDIHKVIVRPDYKKILITLLLKPKKEYFMILFSIDFWRHLIQDGAVPESIIDKLSINPDPSHNLKQILINLISNQLLNQDTMDLLRILKKRGYKLYILSNIWGPLLINLEKKFPELKTLFDGHYIPSAENNYIEKPYKLFFDGFKEYLQQQGQESKEIIFIDDKARNINAAQKDGYIGIKFENTKKLILQLKDLGFNFL